MRRSGSGCGWGVGLSAALILAACRPAPKTTAEPVVPTAAAPRPGAHRAADAPAAVAVATSPLQLLPDTTLAVGSVAGVGALLAVLDVDGLIGKYRSHYDQAAALVTSSAGFNLLDPAQWREVGIDPDGPIGAAMLDLRSETYVGFFTLTDPGKFRGFLDKISGERRMRPVLEDRGLVLKREPDSPTALVLRDGFAFIVSTDRPDEAPYDFARLLATIDPARGLVATTRYQRAIASPEPPRPLTGYVDFWAIIQAQHAMYEARARDPEPYGVELELERAVQAGAPAEQQALLRRQVDEQRAWQRQAEATRKREYEVLRRWFGSVEPVVVELTASRTGVVGKVRVKMPESVPLRSMLRNAATPSPVFAALGERPVVELGGRVDVAALIASFEELAHAVNERPEKAYEALGSFGVDLKKDLAPLLTGAAGFALTASDSQLRGDKPSDLRDLGFALALEAKDPAAAAALIERLPMARGKDDKSGAHSLAVPGYRTVYMQVTAGQLVVSSDPGVIRRMSAGAAASTGLATAVVPVMTARDVAFQGLFDVVLPTVLLGRYSYHPSRDSFEPYAQFPGVTQEVIDKVPRSRAYKAKLRAWEALEVKIRKYEEVSKRQETQRSLALADCFGVLAGNLREHPDGLELVGGQFFGKGGLTRAVELGVERFVRAPEADRSWDLYNERLQVEDELRSIRIIDVSTALGVPRPLQ